MIPKVQKYGGFKPELFYKLFSWITSKQGRKRAVLKRWILADNRNEVCKAIGLTNIYKKNIQLLLTE